MKLQKFSTTQIWNNSQSEGDGEKCPGGSNMTLPTILGVCGWVVVERWSQDTLTPLENHPNWVWDNIGYPLFWFLVDWCLFPQHFPFSLKIIFQFFFMSNACTHWFKSQELPKNVSFLFTRMLWVRSRNSSSTHLDCGGGPWAEPPQELVHESCIRVYVGPWEIGYGVSSVENGEAQRLGAVERMNVSIWARAQIHFSLALHLCRARQNSVPRKSSLQAFLQERDNGWRGGTFLHRWTLWNLDQINLWSLQKAEKGRTFPCAVFCESNKNLCQSLILFYLCYIRGQSALML